MLTYDPKVIDALLAPSRFITSRVELEIEGVRHDITDEVTAIDMENDSGAGDCPFGNVTYNACTITLDNLTKKYTLNNTESPFYGKLKGQMPIYVTYQVYTSDEVYVDVPGGVYYTDVWKATTDSSVATVMGLDRLSLIGKNPVQQIQVKKDLSASEAFRWVFTSVGLKEEEYWIDANIPGSFKYFWADAETFRDLLEKMARSMFVDIFVDKKNTIKVTSLQQKKRPAMVLDDSNVLIVAKTAPTYENIYSACELSYKVFDKIAAEQLVSIEKEVPPGRSIVENIPVATYPVLATTSTFLVGSQDVQIEDLEYVGNNMSITVYNRAKQAKTVTIKVHGTVLQTTTTEAKYVQEGYSNVLSIEAPGAIEPAYAQSVPRKILERFNGSIIRVSVEIRMVPILEVYDCITINSTQAGIQQDFYIVGIKEDMCEGLMGELILMPAEAYQIQKNYVYISPGMSIQIGGK